MKKLKNGIELGARLSDRAQNYYITKSQAAIVFNGTAKYIRVKCSKLDCCNGNSFGIGRSGKSISIGCVRFSPGQVEVVKEWLKVTPRQASK